MTAVTRRHCCSSCRRRQVRELQGAEKAPELLKELFVEGTKQLIDCLPAVWDDTVQ